MDTPPPLILASSSPYRRAQLERLGVPFTCWPPELDEEELRELLAPMGPREIARCLAVMKADAVAAGRPDAVVLAGDQLVAFEGQILGKPGTVEAAVEQLAAMSGTTHELVTAVALRFGQLTISFLEPARLTMRRLDREAIRRYVEVDQPLDCAGAYKLEARGIALFERIECGDHSAITGLPLISLTTRLRGLGFAIP